MLVCAACERPLGNWHSDECTKRGTHVVRSDQLKALEKLPVFEVELRINALSAIAGKVGQPGQPATVEGFIARAIAFGLRANGEHVNQDEIIVRQQEAET